MSSSYGISSVLDVLGFGIGLLIFFAIIGIGCAVVVLIAEYKLFQKMGMDGWRSLVVGVREYLTMEKIGMDQRWALVMTFAGVVCVIPVLGYLALLVATCYYWVLYCIGTAKSFGKETGFGVLTFFFYPIMIAILAFGDSKYVGPRPMNDIIFKNNNSNTNTTNTNAASTNNAAASGKFCSNCGASVPSDSAFCTSCGNKVD